MTYLWNDDLLVMEERRSRKARYRISSGVCGGIRRCVVVSGGVCGGIRRGLWWYQAGCVVVSGGVCGGIRRGVVVSGGVCGGIRRDVVVSDRV